MKTYNIKLFAHGVPKGQDIWGNPSDAENRYIETFYGRQSGIPIRMLTEVMQFDGKTNTYYTYIHCDNIQDKEGRTGSYFALTLCINYYYKDIQNIYNLLEAAFNKFIIGTILEHTSAGYRFLVSQLNQRNDGLKALETELEHYLMQFSCDSDFISLNNFKFNGKNDCSSINLLEATSSIVTDYVKSAGKISVSQLYPSKKEQQFREKMNADMQALKNNAQQEIAAAQQKSHNEITAAQNQAKREIEAAMKDKENGINAIKNEYKDVDRTINQLRISFEDAKKQIQKLSNEKNNLQTDLKKAKEYKTKYENTLSELKTYEEIIANFKKSISKINIKETNSGCTPINKQQEYESNNNVFKTDRKESLMQKLHPYLSLFCNILLIIFAIIFIILKCNDFKDKDLQTLNTFKIDVAGISKTSPMQKDSTYKVSLKYDLKGTWKSKDFIINNHTITPRHTGNCTIEYVIDNRTIASRTINVK